MDLSKRRHHKWFRHLPRKKHLKGGRIHRLLGDRLFDPALWKPTRHEVASGLALGLFIGLTPTMGVQVFIAAVAAFFLKVNIPMAMAGCLVTNPLTAAFIYPLQYQLGLQLVGLPDASEVAGYQGALRNMIRHAKPLWVGCLATGSIAAAISYFLVNWLWVEKKRPPEKPTL